MAPKEKKTKAQIIAAAAGSSKGKKKGKQKDKLNNNVLFDQATFDKLVNEIPKSKLITPSIISERLRINVSLAREAIKELEEKELIKRVGTHHHSQIIYTRVGGD